jgi:hypothetical protein
MNSVSGDPQYKSASDLHALGLVSNNAGLSISGFTTDIDGETRGASPDIGADEYTSSPDDAGIDSVANELFCSGTSNVSATLTNYGTDTLKQVTVNWAVSKNGGSFVSQTPLNWTGSLPTAQSLVIAIGTYNISPDTSYQIRAYTSAPNAKTDGYAGNDSAISANRKPAMSGVYVVAQSGVRDYSTVQNAVSDLSARGVCGATTIRVKDGVYSGSVIIPSVEGASATNSILIESDTSNTKRARLESGYYTVQIT